MDRHLEELINRYPVLTGNRQQILAAYELLEKSYLQKGKLLIAGNGGSASDADHIVGELMKGFCLPRKVTNDFGNRLRNCDAVLGEELAGKLQCGLPAIALSNHNSLNTAFLNDVDGKMCFAQQVLGYGAANDVFLGISTSGNSQNVIYAAVTAKAKDIKVIGLTGAGGGRLAEYADVLIAVDETETYKVQELHLPIYHCLCLMLEDLFFKN